MAQTAMARRMLATGPFPAMSRRPCDGGCALVAFLLFCLVTLIGLSAPARADDLVIGAALYTDPSASLDFDTARQRDFEPVPLPTSQGYSSAAFWLKVDIAPAPDGSPVRLRVFPPVLDQITLFTPAPDKSGDWVTVDMHARPAYGLSGYVLPAMDTPLTIYLRIRSVGSVSPYVWALPINDSVESNLRLNLLQTFYLTLMLALLIWSARMARLTGEPLFRSFALLQTVWSAQNLLGFGYGPVLLPGLAAGTSGMTYRLLVIIVVVVSIAFHRQVIGRLAPPPLTMRLFDVLQALSLVALTLFATGFIAMALTLNALCILALPFVFLVNIFLGKQDASPGRTTLRVVYVALAFSIFLWVFSFLGFAKSRLPSQFNTMLHGTVTGILMFLILHRHGQTLVTALRDAETALLSAEARRAAEREHSRFLLGFIDMLGHETRNAMAVIRMSLGGKALPDHKRLRVEETIDGLNGIIDRSIDVARLEIGDKKVVAAPLSLADLLAEVLRPYGTARIHHDVPENAQITTDPVLLKVALGNLVDNAVKYSAPDTDIRIRYIRLRDVLTLTVENEAGPAGLPDPDKVFRKYYRSTLAHSRIGSGLGLYLVHTLARLLGGSVRYTPEGTTIRFHLTLPC